MCMMANSRRINTIHERLNQTRQEPVFMRRMLRVVDDCVRLSSSDNVPNETLDYCILRLEALERSVQRARGTVVDDRTYDDLNELLKGLIEEFHKGKHDNIVHTGYQAERTLQTRGAPKYNISRDQLSFLLHCGFGTSRISELLGISVSTVKRRIRTFELQSQAEYSAIGDDELDNFVRQEISSNHRIGPNAVRARLFSHQHRIQRWRVRESMLRVDPGGAALRTAPSMQRRTYSVAGPNSLWHIDGNHKLVRWKMVIHGGIDGFSRLIVFLHASNNNRKETVFEHFVTATTLCGIPSRIRVDHGGENNDICDAMELLRGPNRGSAIRGRSVHNQRIERNWVDLWNGATHFFYDLFHFMEQSHHLDVDNHTHMWALHYIFLPRLNAELKAFVDQWNNHGLRTEGHQTPMQLFVGHALELSNARLTAMEDIFRSTDTQAVLFDGEEWDDQGIVAVDELWCPLEEEAVQRLRESINPLSENDQLGITSYLNVLTFIHEHMQR
ncbi:uncharacterized protein [Apostichopus japonicus]|uniref:uncharacterized protein n=1 Tax=Stichopus japonicus TaxID=307972 RepID=UPI003AB172C1